MEGFLTNVTMPVATLVLYLLAPQTLFISAFAVLYAFYAGYHVAGREANLRTLSLLKSAAENPDQSETLIQEMMAGNEKIRSVRAVCKTLVWCVLIFCTVGLCFV